VDVDFGLLKQTNQHFQSACKAGMVLFYGRREASVLGGHLV
jgi:hypothetical protein